MKGRTAWLVTLPIALIGLEIAHAIANAAFGSPAAEGEVFASPASGAQLVPMLLALALALIVVGLVARTAGWWWSPRRARSLALPFACLAPTGFVLLELVEGLLHEGAVSWGSMLEPTFLAGLALQLPFALAGYCAARCMLRLSDRARALLVRRRPVWHAAPPRARSLRSNADRATAEHRGSLYSGRAPPVILASS